MRSYCLGGWSYPRVSWEFFFHFTVNNWDDEKFIHFEDKWRDDRAQPNCVFPIIFLKQLKLSWSNKQTRVTRTIEFYLIKREIEKIKQVIASVKIRMVIVKPDIAMDFITLSAVPFRDLFSYSEIICHLENLRSNIRATLNQFSTANIRLKYPQNFQINLILCLTFIHRYSNRPIKYKNCYFRFTNKKVK